MKNRWKHIFIPVLAMALCLSLAACGNSDDVAGEDWRTTGVVVGSGTIAHDGESVDVLVTVCESSAAFYRDLPEQVLFDSVSFPMNIPDAEQAFNAISFDDMDGDGESDVLVSFIHENGDATELVWIWDPVERYVFREDLSTVTLSGGDLSEYVGLWEYQGENLWLRIHEDATWEFVNDQDDVIEYGTLWVEENGVTLHFDGSGDTLFYQKLPYYDPQFEQGKPYKKTADRGGNSPNYGKFVRSGGGSEDGLRFPGNLLTFPSVQRTVHPTQKPVELCEYFIKTYTRPGEVVADICAGSGTTAVAAVNTGRRFICFETAPAFYAPATERIRLAGEAVKAGQKGV